MARRSAPAPSPQLSGVSAGKPMGKSVMNPSHPPRRELPPSRIGLWHAPSALLSGIGLCFAVMVLTTSAGPATTASARFSAATAGQYPARDSAALEPPPTGFVGRTPLADPIHARPASAAAGSAAAGSAGGVPAETGAVPRPRPGTLLAPLGALVPSSLFGVRTSPVTGAPGEFHTGQDFAAPCGTSVYAADAGVVRAIGWHPWGGGNRIEIDHGGGLVTTYNHLEAVALRAGDRVDPGEVIARVGTTGMSTGCHLHFETILNGRHMDPERWTLVPHQPTGPVELIIMTSFDPGAGSAIPPIRPNWSVYLAGATNRSPAAVPELTAGNPPADLSPRKIPPRAAVVREPTGIPALAPGPAPMPTPTPRPTPLPAPDNSPSPSLTPPPIIGNVPVPDALPIPDASPAPDVTPAPEVAPEPTPDTPADPAPGPGVDPTPAPEPPADPTPDSDSAPAPEEQSPTGPPAEPVSEPSLISAPEPMALTPTEDPGAVTGETLVPGSEPQQPAPTADDLLGVQLF